MAQWISVCSVADLQPNSGVCALVGGEQVAIFHMVKDNAIYAIHNYDPIGKANVLSRGVIGDIKGEPVVASPLYKQHFSLISGCCLEDAQVKVPIYQVRIHNSNVEVDVSAIAAFARKDVEARA
jgi:nitrite reductase (NADH) small subunit